MSKCWNCEIEITLKDEEVVCDACKEIVRWWCCNCAKPFDVQDIETKKKLRECKACGFFECPLCGSCDTHCPKIRWSVKLKEISPTLTEEQIKRIVDYFEIVKLGKEKKVCGRGVPKTYAKGKIKNMLIKMEGFKTKNDKDKNRFKERIKKLLDKDVDFTFTVNDAREDGHYGQEYRDVFNLGICMGEVEVIWKKNKDNTLYAVFKRIEKGACPYFNFKNLIVNYCKKCGKTFSEKIKQCDICQYQKGERKGEYYDTKIKISNKDICQLKRIEFQSLLEQREKIKEEKVENAKD